jgi:serine/threonine-protein kinase
MADDRSKKATRRSRTAGATMKSGAESPHRTPTESGHRTRVEGTGRKMPSEPPSLETSSPRRFRDLGEIARGGMSAIRRVYDTVLRREVAMKTGDPSSPSYAKAALRFVEEAQVTGQLDHPNIVPVHDLGTSPEIRGVFFTMKLVQGETLTDIIDRLHRSSYDHRAVESTLQIFLRICDAISFAHSRGVIHRDLKPDNVMVGSYGQVYVMDWGIALLLGRRGPPPPGAPPFVNVSDDLTLDDREERGAIVGTFEYMAAEQAWGKNDEVDERTDVFGLGGILYQLLTGRGPNAATTAFESLQRAQRGMHDPPHGGAWTNLPPGLCRIAMKALAKEPRHRYASVAELKVDVEDFLRGGGWFQTEIFESGETIVEQGAKAETAYIIVAGHCSVVQTNDGRVSTLRQLGPADVFGETALLTGEPRSASVIALDRVTVKVVTADALERELGSRSWAGAFVKALAERFREADAELAKLR